MESHILLMQIAAILVSARVFAEIAARFNTPRVIGELCAGVVLGPSLLGWIEPGEPIKLLAEIGIILLLFEIGLETDLGKMVKSGNRAMILALAGFIAPFLLGFGICYYTFDLPMLVSLFIGGTLTATSIGVTVRILADLGRNSSREGQIVLGAAVVDDVMGVVLLALLYEFSVTDTISMANAGKIALFVGVFFVLAPIVAKLLSYAIHHFHNLSEAPGMIPVGLISLVLTFAAIAHMVGAPELLGGFAAGIALSRRFFLPFGISLRVDPDFGHHMHQQMKPIIHIFSPIFFVMVGLSLDLSAVDWGSPFIWFFSITVTAVAIVGKLIGGLMVPEDRYTRIAIGMAMVPRGEVGLIFAELGRVSGVFDNEVYAGMVIVIAYTTLLSPFWIKLYYRIYGDRLARIDSG
ncbi:sodium:proton antiporter [Solemya pervernicosa gill symbiont]|uniref:Sodium:proton antiporter n=2 Tax=Gammaproteobacteria incertae sedis TaxID=118884 RepID=A0A1T2L408_9GAMM|nr:cation:proton antiporter [Candidatus Reidiella endopervernicosa]OOZ39760.1 sodium:proton antiporter [Solemya pervernicosa gill symbiont]QKQ27915.1 cation:proton antiporter [Candidatus Reidiella endopervernicosa]